MKPEAVVLAPTGLDRRRFGQAFAAGAVSLACPGLGPSCARAADTPALSPDIKAIKDRGQLIIGMTEFDSSPFYYTPPPPKEGAVGPGPGLEGFDLRLANDIATVLDVSLVVNRTGTSFNAVVDLVTDGKIDIAISKLSVTPRRAISVQFTRPTIELRHALLANRLSLAKKTIDGDIRSVINRNFDGTLGVIAKSSYAEIAKQIFTKSVLREFENWKDVVEAVEKGEVDFAYRDELEIKKLMRQRPELHLTLKSVLITDIRDSIAAAVPSRSLQLLGVIDVILAQRRRMDANQLLDQYPNIFQPA